MYIYIYYTQICVYIYIYMNTPPATLTAQGGSRLF